MVILYVVLMCLEWFYMLWSDGRIPSWDLTVLE